MSVQTVSSKTLRFQAMEDEQPSSMSFIRSSVHESSYSKRVGNSAEFPGLQEESNYEEWDQETL
eukprot:CAMPEP_0170451038 /NCGR_PEP_ID=MMETSP0123-20130129/401_1 /TAXON_ID=182087 /ORGANISM="Favella ehrenbergii, Strain Fehren 1" /LENGTH=63 /DNA_ID=CAMNT_0010712573 /DNA_START=135 /DNA_END=326 /DNA_ORIENTATION=+